MELYRIGDFETLTEKNLILELSELPHCVKKSSVSISNRKKSRLIVD